MPQRHWSVVPLGLELVCVAIVELFMVVNAEAKISREAAKVRTSLLQIILHRVVFIFGMGK